MGAYTYEHEDRQTVYETWEWDNVWIERTDDREAKRVLYIGDSISVDTRQAANRQAADAIRFDSFSTSKAVDNHYFKAALRTFAEQQPGRDAVIFNNGLHGWHLSDDAEYPQHYEEMVRFLMDAFPGTPVAVILTTHVASEKREARVVARNAAVKAIAKKYHLPVIDLHTLTAARPELLGKDGVHFTPEGWTALADQVIAGVKSLFEDGAR